VGKFARVNGGGTRVTGTKGFEFRSLFSEIYGVKKARGVEKGQNNGEQRMIRICLGGADQSWHWLFIPGRKRGAEKGKNRKLRR